MLTPHFFWRADAICPLDRRFPEPSCTGRSAAWSITRACRKTPSPSSSWIGQTHRLCPEDQLDRRPDDPATVLRGSRPARPLHAAGTERSAAAARLRLSGSSASLFGTRNKLPFLPREFHQLLDLLKAGSGAGHPGSTRRLFWGRAPPKARRPPAGTSSAAWRQTA